MSVKRISRRRVAAPVTDSVDEELFTTTSAGQLDNARTGGNVETKDGSYSKSSVESGDAQSRVGSNVETRNGSYSKWSA